MTDVQDSLSRVTHFDWCACGSLESITDPMGRLTTWIRDLQGRVTTKIYPDNSQVNYTYENNSSRLKSVTDAKNQTTWYEYWKDDNLKKVSYSNAVVATPTVQFYYDTNYNRLVLMVDGIGTNLYSYYGVSNGVPGAGRLQSNDGPLDNDTITFSYDELGRVSSQAINGVAQNATYDALGRVTVLTNALGSFTNVYDGVSLRISTNFYPNGQKSVFSYYGASSDFRLQQISHSTSNTNLSTFAYTYDPDGQIQTWTQQAGNGTPKVWGLDYDPVDQLLAATVRSNDVAGAILKRYVYGYDNAGNRKSEQIDWGVTKANYNDLNQLTDTVGGGPVRFAGRLSEPGTVQVAGSPAVMGIQNTSFVAYAETGLGTNIVNLTATDYSTNTANTNYMIVVTNNGVTRTLAYDLNGNLTNMATAISTNTYEWDAANRLTKITQLSTLNPQLTSEFTYDGLGRRVRIVEKTNGVVQSDHRFLWVGTALSEERDSTGATVTKRFFGQGEQISGTNYFFNRDHLGSVREMADTAGIIRARYEYDPFRRRIKLQGDLECDFGFTGNFFHQASGAYLALYRAYDAETGRWLSQDPLGESGGINLYAYVGNNPLNAADPLGLVSSLNTPAGAAVMAWVLGGAATGGIVGGSARGIAESIRQVRCHEADPNKVVSAALAGMYHGMYWGALLGPVFGYLGEVAIPAYYASRTALTTGAAGARALVYCFSKGTEVETPSGKVKIEDIKIGDEVLSYNFQQQKAVVHKVTKIVRNATQHWYVIGVEGETIKVTGAHPFWVQSENCWVNARDLKVGMALKQLDGSVVLVSSVEFLTLLYPEDTYNFEVEYDHNYFAGSSSYTVLAHNTDPMSIYFSRDPALITASDTFSHGDWAGRTLSEAVAEARSLGRLPEGLRINASWVGDTIVTANNRTLWVAQQAGIQNVSVEGLESNSVANQVGKHLKVSGGPFCPP